MPTKEQYSLTKTMRIPATYWLCWDASIEGSMALAPRRTPPDCYEPILPQDRYVYTWNPIKFKLSKPVFNDYLPNDEGLHLFSERFRKFIDQHKQPKDSFQWLENPVICGNEERPYYILHFYDHDDVLDESKVIWHPAVPGNIIRPAFSACKIQGHAIFTYVNPGNPCDMDTPYVTKDLKKAILKAKMTGATHFEKTLVVNDLE